jgi:uncharacterized protein (TIGR02246 family)
MMRLFLLAVMLLSAMPAQTSNDEAAVKAVVARYVEAREKRDAAGIAAVFTPDADQLVSSGEWRKGREALVKGTLASSESTGGHRTITVESVRFVSADVALADGRYEISGMASGPDRRMWSTFVMKRGADGWRISAIRNMLPAPPAGR